MHLHVYRDENRSGHIDLVGEGDRPWAIDLVAVIIGGVLVVSYAGALAANILRI